MKNIFNKLAIKAYGIAKNRGKITDETTFCDFINALKDEIKEAELAFKQDLNVFPDKKLKSELKEYSQNNISKFLDIYENKIKDTVQSEITDCIIVLLSFAEHLGIDLDFHIAQKIRYNELRDAKKE